MKKYAQWALYDNEEKLLADGTMKQIADKMNIKEKTVAHYASPAYERKVKKSNEKKGRRVLIRLEE